MKWIKRVEVFFKGRGKREEKRQFTPLCDDITSCCSETIRILIFSTNEFAGNSLAYDYILESGANTSCIKNDIFSLMIKRGSD